MTDKERIASEPGCGPVDPLGSLGLPENVHQALARQGFVAAEFRGEGSTRRGPYYKLRWREGRRQRVKYLGRDPALAERIRAAVEYLQRPRRLIRMALRLIVEARRGLRRAKDSLQSRAATCGRKYHGYTSRAISTTSQLVKMDISAEAEKTASRSLPVPLPEEGKIHGRENDFPTCGPRNGPEATGCFEDTVTHTAAAVRPHRPVPIGGDSTVRPFERQLGSDQWGLNGLCQPYARDGGRTPEQVSRFRKRMRPAPLGRRHVSEMRAADRPAHPDRATSVGSTIRVALRLSGTSFLRANVPKRNWQAKIA